MKARKSPAYLVEIFEKIIKYGHEICSRVIFA